MPPRTSHARGANVRRGQRGKRGKHGPRRKGNRSGGILGAQDVPGLVNTTFSVMGRRRNATLRYNDSVAVSGTFTAGGQVWGLNCLYDPNITSTGTQPMGFDQMMAFFEHYTVTSCRIKMTLQNQTAGANAQVWIRVDGDVTLVTDVYRLGELGMTTTLILAPFGVAGAIAVVEKTISIGSFMSVRDLLEEFEMRGTIAANPAEAVYLHTMIANPNGGTTVTVMTYVTMEFKAVFTEPRNLVRSLPDRRLNHEFEELKISLPCKPCCGKSTH
jgi:hypothetical protein